MNGIHTYFLQEPHSTAAPTCPLTVGDKTRVRFRRSLLCKYVTVLNGSMREFTRRLSTDSTVLRELIAVLRAVNVRTSPHQTFHTYNLSLA